MPPDNSSASISASRQRQADRSAVRLTASIRERSATAHDAVINNLSRTGCMVSNTYLRAGRPVWVRFGSLAPIESRVIWARGDSAGIRFSQPLHPAVLDHIAARAHFPQDDRSER